MFNKFDVPMWMDIAKRIAARKSHDLETQVGFLAIDPNTKQLLSYGANTHADGSDRSVVPCKGDEKHATIIHAEENAIIMAARLGVRLEDAVGISTLSPCARCARLLLQAGIRTVYFDSMYRKHTEMMRNVDITQHSIKHLINVDGYGVVWEMFISPTTHSTTPGGLDV